MQHEIDMEEEGEFGRELQQNAFELIRGFPLVSLTGTTAATLELEPIGSLAPPCPDVFQSQDCQTALQQLLPAPGQTSPSAFQQSARSRLEHHLTNYLDSSEANTSFAFKRYDSSLLQKSDNATVQNSFASDLNLPDAARLLPTPDASTSAQTTNEPFDPASFLKRFVEESLAQTPSKESPVAGFSSPERVFGTSSDMIDLLRDEQPTPTRFSKRSRSSASNATSQQSSPKSPKRIRVGPPSLVLQPHGARAVPSSPQSEDTLAAASIGSSPVFRIQNRASNTLALDDTTPLNTDTVDDQTSDVDMETPVKGPSVKFVFNPNSTPLVVTSVATGNVSLIEKLSDLLEDIFASEDELVETGARAERQQTDAHFIASTFTATSDPHLSLSTTKMLSKLFSQISKHAKASAELPTALDVSRLSRLIKILERTIVQAAETQPISSERLKLARKGVVDDDRPVSPKKSKQTKTPKKKLSAARRQLSDEEGDDNDVYQAKTTKSPGGPEVVRRRSSRSRSHSASMSDQYEEEEDRVTRSPTKSPRKSPQKATSTSADDDISKFASSLDVVIRGISAVNCVLTLLASAKLDKQLYSENVVSLCLKMIKDRLSDTCHPLIEALGKLQAGQPTILAAPLQNTFVQSLVEDILNAFASALPKIDALLVAETMPESIIITAVYISLGPFFADQGSPPVTRSKGKSKEKNSFSSAVLQSLRMSALLTLRTIFAKYAPQRHWIVDEILNSLDQVPDIKQKTFRLHNGARIHTVSALILQLIQSCCYNLATKLSQKRHRLTENQEGNDSQEVDSELRLYCRQEVSAANESAALAALRVVSFLFAKSASTSRISSEADYKIVLETLVSDALAVLHISEWPASQVFIQACLQKIFSILGTTKVSPETTAARPICLDLLGAIGAKLSALKSGQVEPAYVPLSNALSGQDFPEMQRTLEAHQTLISILSSARDEDGTFQTAAEFEASRFCSELLKTLERSSKLRENPESATTAIDMDMLQTFDAELTKAMLNVWEIQIQAKQASRVYSEDDEGTRTAAMLTRGLAWSESQRSLYDSVLQRLLLVLDSSEAATHRSKALKCLGQIVAEDANVFKIPEVRLAIERRFKDAQSSVRDAAFDLLGEYIVHRPDLAVDYLPRIAERIADTGLNVRKRVIKLLKRLFVILEDEELRTMIVKRVLWRIKDEDGNVKDLAVSAIEEMIFSPSSSVRRSRTSGKQSVDGVESIAQILRNVAGGARERPPPIEEALKIIMLSRKDNVKAMSDLNAQVSALCAFLVEGIQLDESFKKTNAASGRVGCVKILDILVQACPSVLTCSQLDTLIPHLYSSETESDVAVRDYLLKIMRTSAPLLSASSLPVAMRLQEALTALLNRPPGAVATLHALVSCLCQVMINHTHQVDRLCAIFGAVDKSLNDKIAMYRNLPPKTQLGAVRPISVLLYIFALICESANFDKIREETEDDQMLAEIDNLTQSSVASTAFNKLFTICRDPGLGRLKAATITSFGFLFRAFPTLLNREEATLMMDEVFAAPEDAENQATLLNVFHDFLSHQASKNSDGPSVEEINGRTTPKQNAKPSIDELVGNTEAFADSGVGPAVVQRYLPQILAAALSPRTMARNAAIEVIHFTITLGLAHPVQSLSTIVCLEMSEELPVSRKALSLHAVLQSKHAGLVNTRYLECTKAAFLHLKSLDSTRDPRGYRTDLNGTVSLLSSWYNLLKEKRQWRLDFLKALSKAFVTDPALPCSSSNVALVRFVTDCLATLEYKTQEEIFILLRALDHTLADSAMQVCQLLQERVAEICEEEIYVDSQGNQNVENVDLQSLICHSMVLQLAIALRDHLKLMYGLSDAKCAKYNPNKKSAIGDKVPIRQDDMSPIIVLSDFAFLSADLIPSNLAQEDCINQANAFENQITHDASVLAGNEESDEE